jgi:hypothetical protein
MISDDCNAERDAREPSNDVLDLDLRVVIEEGSEHAKTEQAREYQRSETPRASITVFSDLGFHGCPSSTYTLWFINSSQPFRHAAMAFAVESLEVTNSLQQTGVALRACICTVRAFALAAITAAN